MILRNAGHAVRSGESARAKVIPLKQPRATSASSTFTSAALTQLLLDQVLTSAARRSQRVLLDELLALVLVVQEA